MGRNERSIKDAVVLFVVVALELPLDMLLRSVLDEVDCSAEAELFGWAILGW